MKKFKKLLLILLILPCFFMLNACSFFQTEAYVTAIEKTESIGNVSTYTVYFSNGTQSTFTVNDGLDGKDGSDLTIQSIKDYCTANNINFESFLKNYLTVIQVVEKAPTIQDATNIALQSTVSIWCEFPTSGYRGANKNTSVGCGSGVIYQMSETYSYIITNYHVVYMSGCDTENDIAREIHIFQYGTSEKAYKLSQKNQLGQTSPVYDEYGYPEITYGYGAVKATYVGGELTYDLAVLKVKTADLLKYNENAKPVTIANDYQIGETVMAIGNPEGEGTSVTSGIISVVSEDLEMKGADDITACIFRVMRIDAAVNGGNSGGGLFNVYGEWIGTVNAKVVSTNIDNIAYAIPYDNVTAVINNILYYYNGTNISKLKKLDLGITFTAENSHSIYDEEKNRTIIVDDATIESIKKDSIAETIGLKVNDIIKTISINGTVYEITRTYQILDILLNVRAGDKIIIQVKREGSNELQSCSIATEEGVLESYLKTIS